MKRDRFESGLPDAVAQGESPEKRSQAEDKEVLPARGIGKAALAKSFFANFQPPRPLGQVTVGDTEVTIFQDCIIIDPPRK